MFGRTSARPNIRLIRQKLELTQEQLAFLLGVTKDTVYRWEKQGGIMSPLARSSLAAFLRQPHVVQQLAAAMTPEDLLAALGEQPTAQPQASSR